MKQIIQFFLENRLITAILIAFLTLVGIIVIPFNLNLNWLPHYPISVDAIPDIGENQQIVFTQWQGRSPKDIEDQITYPLTSALLGIAGVKTIRSSSAFGFSSIYIIFDEKTEFYWSRSRILEKLNALPLGTLPQGVQPSLGPDATALGQIFWYTLEGKDTAGNLTGGWDLHELRSIQDFYVRYGLMAVEGVAEVASIGGFVKEYQIDLNPYAMKAHKVSLAEIVESVRNSNLDVGAKTIEINKAEYFVRGLGYVKNIADLEEAVVVVNDHIPICIKDIATVSFGPATRRGILDKGGAEVVGGVVVARYGANPMEIIKRIHAKIAEIEIGLPSKELSDGTISQIKIISFYDRKNLIRETLGTLKEALSLQILITIIVIMVMLANINASILVSILLPLVVLSVFVIMKILDITANIVSLSGIAIAIGTIVDIGIVFTENLLRNLRSSNSWKNSANFQSKILVKIIFRSINEVRSAILTAIITTIVSFIPVFALQGAEGKLFSPLAFTKTSALIAAVIITFLIMPACAYWIFGLTKYVRLGKKNLLLLSINFLSRYKKYILFILSGVVILTITYVLTTKWLPLKLDKNFWLNFLFVNLTIGLILGILYGFYKAYPYLLIWCLNNKKKFLLLPIIILLFSVTIWKGFDNIFSFEKGNFFTKNEIFLTLKKMFPGIGEEFMPVLDEGTFLLMPTSMPHAGISENHRILKQLDMAVKAIPEIDWVVGKLGRVSSPLDPAPISMYENIIQYKNEYVTDENGSEIGFKVDKQGNFLIKDEQGDISILKKIDYPYADIKKLIPKKNGKYFRQWRDHIRSTDDIWEEIIQVTHLPGLTSAPKLQPIATRLVMLQTGMRAPIGIKIKGKDLQSIEDFGKQLESHIKQVPSVKSEAVFAERIVGKPYLNIVVDRKKIAKYGLRIKDIQLFIETFIGGIPLDRTVEGRERYTIRVRYPRELRDNPQALKQVLLTTPQGIQIPLSEVANIVYQKGSQMIKSEDTFLTGYVLLDKKKGYAEVEVVEEIQTYLKEKIQEGTLKIPDGISFKFAGTYENQLRAKKQLALIIPICIFLILIILYFQFRSTPVVLMIASGIIVAFSGGFIMLWLYAQPWWMNFNFFGENMHDLFQIKPINLSVAVWVGFIALFGIATDDGVLMATYLHHSFQKNQLQDSQSIKEIVLTSAKRRIRPALMTSATTLLALLPIFTSTGKGASIMIPMAIPCFGGMIMALITLFIVPVLYCAWIEFKRRKN